MFSKNNKLMNDQGKGEKITRYSIKKYSFGAVSVAVAFGIYFANGPVVSAQELSNSSDLVSASQVPVAPESQSADQEQSQVASQAAESSAKELEASSQASESSSQADQQSQASETSQEAAQELSDSAQPEAKAEVAPQADKPVVKTPGYPVKPVAKPTSAAMPRPSSQGQTIPKGTGFRDSGATGIPIGTGPAGADDATATPRVDKPSWDESVKKDSVQLAKQISWLDFSDSASWKNLDSRGGLKVGTTFTKEISPGYVVTLTVKELKPFNSTEIYRKRVAGTATEGTYNPNAENGFLQSARDYGKTPPPSVTGAAQNQWTTIRDQGFNTQNRKTQLVYPKNSTNWGVKFDIEATYLGKRVAPTVVMADGEDANPGEFAIFTTNGSGWEYMGEWKKSSPAKEAYTVITKKMLDDEDVRLRGLLILKDKSVDWYKYLSPDTVTGGLGTQVFGPNRSNERTVPVVMTRGASEVGFYVASSGQQAMMMGFLVVDGSDAPESYGEAFHTISRRDSVTDAPINQPYLGTTPADIDVESANDWLLDDKKEHNDEGASQLLADDQLSKSNDLLDLDKAKNGTYTIKIKANPNGNAKSYVKAWIDFNKNGVFDEDEASNLQEVTTAGDYTLTFKANPAINGGQVDELGMRFRIATNAGDIEKPTGIAFSGEVEDMLLHRIFPPKGEKQTTDGFTGETQNATLHFTTSGGSRDDNNATTTMTSQAPQVLDNQGNVLQSADGTTYIRPEGTYVVTSNGNDVQVAFTPNAAFSGTAEGINIRWTDSNGTSTGWNSTDASDPNKNDQLSTMDGRYVPTVRKIPNYETTGIQGLDQNKMLVFNDDDSSATPVTPDASRPASFVNASGQPVVGNTVPAMANGQQVGTYELDPNTGQVTFKPNKNFYGTPDPVVVQVNDTDGKPHRARYQPKVTQVTPTSTNAESTGLQGQPQSGKPSFNPGDPQIPIDMNKAMTFENGKDTLEVANEGTYTINADGSITFKPLKQFTGKATPVTVKRVDANGTEVTATYTPNVTKVTPSSTPATSSGPQGVPQTGTPVFKEGDPAVPIDYSKQMTFDDGQPKKTVAGVGEYTINSDGSITFTPDKKYVGTPAPVTVKRVDENGTEVTATYTPTVTEVTPRSTNAVSSGLQGQPQSGKPTFTPGDQAVPIDMTKSMTFDDGQTTKKVDKVGTYVIESDGTITFTPDKQYVGTPTPVTVKRVDTNGTEVTATYTPTVTRVTPSSTNAESTGLQGQPQSGKPTFTPGDQAVPIDMAQPMTFENGTDTLVVANEGTYTINSDGSITFQPLKQFTGKATPVTVKRVDTNGTEVTATYTPNVTKVTPSSTPATSSGPQGVPQTGTPVFKEGDPAVPIDQDSPMTFEDGQPKKTVQGVGEYSINPDGTITFTPDKQYVGTPAPVTVKRVDKNGTEVTATYTPTVNRVTPTSTNAESNGVQGQPQKGTPTFTEGDPLVPLDDTKPMTFEDGSSTKTVPNVGVYTINPDGSITFTPDKQFVGTPDPVTVKRVDKNGTPVTATYTPTVARVTPTSSPATSTGVQGVPQTGTPVFTPGDPLVPIDADSPMTFEDGSSTKTVPNVGVYTINPDGSITFTPDKQYVGTPDSVTVKRVDKNGTPVTATYTPTVARVTPTSSPATSTGVQGKKQTARPVFTPGASVVPMDDTVPMTFEDGTTTKTVIGEGVYTIQADGSIEFVPEKTFTGQGSQLTVKRVDKNGTPVTATYQATVVPVKPGANDDYSSGVVNQAQTGQVKFTPGSAKIDGTEQSVDLVPGSLKFVVNGQAVADTTIPALDQDGKQVGTYSLAQDGTVTFTPNPGYVGQPVPARVQATDVNGTTAEATYSPVVNASVTSEGMKGQSQSKLPDFKGQVDTKVPAYLEGGVTSVTVPGQGTYTVNPETGEVTFTPEPDFIGQASPITVIRRDVNGKELKIQYIPTVYGQAKTQDTTSTGYPGEKQTGTPVFEGDVDLTIPATFENGQTELTVPGEGTYVLNPDGSVTFTPEAGFLGQASGVTVVRVDRNGRKVTAQYVPSVVPVPVAPSEPEVQTQGLLPATGEAPDYSFFSGVALTILASVGLVATRKRQATDED
ncbi:CshA/CshB family fibrillar adhesin-related protein [uncultured Abiotrophia sp.]|uniref:CshA/CshB family fibrillar adhesin-related protein n=1 Tax=uncultured Abiotrophia sp. TaxID=316094 RepID=UPI002610B201|nr:CshA/CshB family fibrillar adhesin-related protein [uncultured Abiotrophia sp.]